MILWEQCCPCPDGLDGEIEQYWCKTTGLSPDGSCAAVRMSREPLNPDRLRDILRYRLPAKDIYDRLYDLWLGLKEPEEFARTANERFHGLMQEFLSFMLPENLPGFFKKPRELVRYCLRICGNLTAEYMPEEDRENPERLYQYFSRFNRDFDSRFGKYFSGTSFALSRQEDADERAAAGAYLKMLLLYCELVCLLRLRCDSIGLALVEAMEERGDELKLFDDYYKLWCDICESKLIDLFFAEEYSFVYSQLLTSSMKYEGYSKKVYENNLAGLPIVRESEIRALYRSVYDLKKEVSELQQELQTLKQGGAADA